MGLTNTSQNSVLTPKAVLDIIHERSKDVDQGNDHMFIPEAEMQNFMSQYVS